MTRLYSDIYQNCGFGYSATILLVASLTPLPAGGINHAEWLY